MFLPDKIIDVSSGVKSLKTGVKKSENMGNVRQGCVMPPWLFSLLLDGVVRQMKLKSVMLEWK